MAEKVHRYRRSLGIIVANMVLLGLAACAFGMRLHFRWITTFLDPSIAILVAVLLGQLAIVTLIFAMLEPRSIRRWPIAFLFGVIGSTIGLTAYRWVQFRPWLWSEDVDELLYMFSISLATFIGACLLVRVAWWPFRQITGCWMQFKDRPAENTSHLFSVGELMCWTGASAGAFALIATFRETELLVILLAFSVPIAINLPVAIAAMATAFRLSKGRWAILLGTMILVTIAEVLISAWLFGMRAHLERAVLVFNVVLASTVLANFYWLRVEGLQLVRNIVDSAFDATAARQDSA